MHAKSIGPTRPAATGGVGPNGALQTLHEVRWSGAMMPQPGHTRTPAEPSC
jgi:hypothetical protein